MHLKAAGVVDDCKAPAWVGRQARRRILSRALEFCLCFYRLGLERRTCCNGVQAWAVLGRAAVKSAVAAGRRPLSRRRSSRERARARAPSPAEAGIGRFSMCFSEGAEGVLRLGGATKEDALRSVGMYHWGLDFRGVSVGSGKGAQRMQFCSPDDLQPGQDDLPFPPMPTRHGRSGHLQLALRMSFARGARSVARVSQAAPCLFAEGAHLARRRSLPAVASKGGWSQARARGVHALLMGPIARLAGLRSL